MRHRAFERFTFPFHMTIAPNKYSCSFIAFNVVFIYEYDETDKEIQIYNIMKRNDYASVLFLRRICSHQSHINRYGPQIY